MKEPNPPALPVGELLTRADAARILKVTPKTIARWSAAGRIKAYVLGRTVVRYAANDVSELLSNAAMVASIES